MPITCSIHTNVTLKCLPGESAHPNNWYCEECEKESMKLKLQTCPKCNLIYSNRNPHTLADCEGIRLKHNNEMLSSAWIHSCAMVTYRSYEDVAKDFAQLKSFEYSHSKYLHSSIAYLYKAYCMPILLYPKDTIYFSSEPNNLLYTAQSLKLSLARKIHIRIVRLKNIGLYSFPVFIGNDIRDLHYSIPDSREEKILKDLPIHSAIVIGM